MSKLYGEAIRKDAGVTKTIKRVAQNNASLLKGVVEVQGTVEKVYDETAEALEEFLHRCERDSPFRDIALNESLLAAPKLSGVMNNTRVLLRQSAERLIIRSVPSLQVQRALTRDNQSIRERSERARSFSLCARNRLACQICRRRLKFHDLSQIQARRAPQRQLESASESCAR